jgi:hypothetical protein
MSDEADGTVVIVSGGMPAPLWIRGPADERFFIGDLAAHPVLTIPASGGEIIVYAGREEPLATLRHVDGRWRAEYEPEHLDEAARAFLDAVNLLGSQMAMPTTTRADAALARARALHEGPHFCSKRAYAHTTWYGPAGQCPTLRALNTDIETAADAPQCTAEEPAP